MKDLNKEKPPALVVEYTDPAEGFQGWLVIDSLDHTLCAGGMRVQKGLTREHLVRMAANMTCKMRICGLRVDGAKSGIDYDPASPGKLAAMSRFLKAISPYVRSRYSMGPDMNVVMPELEEIAAKLGIDSVKMAVAAAQGWDMDYFRERYAVLSRKVHGWPLGRLRVGYGVAMASLAVLEHLDVPFDQATAAFQGFGSLAKAAAMGLIGRGVQIVAVADQERSIVSMDGKGLDIGPLLERESPVLPEMDYGDNVRIADRQEIFSVPCDILIPAARENAITDVIARRLPVRAVVPGANLAIAPDADSLLHERGIVALPDLLAGSGGSLSMEGLFGPEHHPGPEEVLAHVERRMTELVKQILTRSREEGISPSRAARIACSEIAPQPGTRAYGKPH